MYTSHVLLLVGLLVLGIAAQANVAYFWHVTDAHIDQAYVVGGDPDCGSVLCCRGKRANQTRFAGEFGSPGMCDVPPKTFQSVLDFVKTYPVTPSFIYYGGDSVVHQDWDNSQEFVADYINLAAKMFQGTFANDPKFKNVPIIPGIGNHDTYPIDQLDFASTYNWLFANFTNAYPTLASDAKTSFSKNGYYHMEIVPGFRALVLNTQYQDPINFFNYRNLTDPGNQLAWVEKVLFDAQQAKEKVIILGHIPPGINDRDAFPLTLPSFTSKFQTIVNRYSEVIVGQLYGHTHQDSFKIFRDGDKPTSVAYTTPSATAWTDQNPSVRLYKYDKTTFQLLDMLTFYSNLTQANLEGKMTWQLEYSATEAYGMKDLSPAEWDNVLQRMKTDKSVWLKFESYFKVLNEIACPSGEDFCKKRQLCAISHQNYGDYVKCNA